MAYFRTRAQVRERLILETQRESGTGAYSDEKANSNIQNALDEIWFDLIKADEGFGITRETFTILADSSTMEIPDEFFELRAIYLITDGETRNKILKETTYHEVEERQFDILTGEPYYYLLEGPGRENVASIYTDYKQRLRFWPPLRSGDKIRITATMQPPSYGDPSDVNDDTISLDLIAEPILAAIVFTAALKVLRREDNEEYKRCSVERAQALARYQEIHGRRDRHGIRYLDQYRNRRVR